MSFEIRPSPAARQIYGMMVVRAEENGNTLHLSLAHTIELSVTLQRQGSDGQASAAVAELEQASWIAPVHDGGWTLS